MRSFSTSSVQASWKSWATTMNPANRMVRQVTVEDAQAADETFTMLMGDHVPPRRKFIQTHAMDVRNLDV